MKMKNLVLALTAFLSVSSSFASFEQKIVCSKKASAQNSEFYRVEVTIKGNDRTSIRTSEIETMISGKYLTPGLYSGQNYSSSTSGEYYKVKVSLPKVSGKDVVMLLGDSYNPNVDDDAAYFIMFDQSIVGQSAKSGTIKVYAVSEIGKVSDQDFVNQLKTDLVHSLPLENCYSFVK